MKKTELYAKLSSKEFDKLTREEIDYLKNKISNDKLGLKLDFTEMDKEDLENYFVLREEESLGINVKKDQPNNLLIEGDNYHALKALKAAGVRVDIIYIDPPYNTGKEFVYKDDFGTPQTVGSDDPHKHSKWLSFMKKRLDLAKELLSDEGVIFVSIDDNEQAYLKVLMDEIFGEENFLSVLTVMSNRGGRDYGPVALQHEYILLYKNGLDQEWGGLSSAENLTFEDEFSKFSLMELRNRNIAFHIGNRPNLYYPFYINPNSKDENGLFSISLSRDDEFTVELFPKESQGIKTVWRWGREKSSEWLNRDIKAKQMKDGGWQIVQKYRSEIKKIRSILDQKEYTTNSASLALKEIFGEKAFDFPKSVNLISDIFKISKNKDAVILDFFAGSGTTGQAVMELNAEDDGNRRFILVTNNEMANVDTKAHPELGIARAITRERLFRIINEQGTNGESIKWSLGGKLKNNSVVYLVTDKVHKVNGEYESIDSKINLYKREFGKEISIEDFE